MSSLISLAARTGPSGRRAMVLTVPLLAAGALAAGCGSAHTGAASGTASARAAMPTASASSAAPSSAAPASSAGEATATPVPTISSGRPVPGQPACVGWPTGATSAPLPVSFTPVSVERCVNGVQTIPGKGTWTTATLQRSASGLAGLISALRQPAVAHKPGTVCPALAVIPPQVVLIGANGEKLIPRLPATGCGLIQSQVLAALNALRWQPVTVRLIAKLTASTAPTVSGAAPHSVQTVGGTGSQ